MIVVGRYRTSQGTTRDYVAMFMMPKGDVISSATWSILSGLQSITYDIHDDCDDHEEHECQTSVSVEADPGASIVSTTNGPSTVTAFIALTSAQPGSSVIAEFVVLTLGGRTWNYAIRIDVK